MYFFITSPILNIMDIPFIITEIATQTKLIIGEILKYD